MSAGVLIERFAAVRQFLDAVDFYYLPEDVLAPARTLTDRASARLGLSGEHTVVALAGATGTGKSSLFNAIAGVRLSPVGSLRPTTGEAYACVWNPIGVHDLLDWLRVAPQRRFTRESALDAEDQAGLRGLVLVDLPDFGSVEVAHQLESDRLLALVDLVVWVLDPQKYADRLVHETYLKGFPGLTDVTMVVLNQIDRLTPENTARCVADLARLLEVDGLAGVPVIGTSAVTGEGVDGLRHLLERAVSSRRAALTRLGGELDKVVEGLVALVPHELPDGVLGAGAVRDLVDALASASGVEAVVVGIERGYAHGAVPWRRGRAAPPGIPLATPQPAAVGMAVRGFVDSTAAAVPDLWGQAVRAAAPASTESLADGIGAALEWMAPEPPRPGPGWTVLRIAWWAGWLGTLAGVGWLAASGLDTLFGGGTVPWPVWGLPVPLLLIALGLLVGLAIRTAAGPLTRHHARRVRAAAEHRLRQAIDDVARERVVEPVRAVLHAYDDARNALRTMP